MLFVAPCLQLPSDPPTLACTPAHPPDPHCVQICREADGFRPHLVSPEKGIKRLVQEAMQQTSPYVHKFVDEIHLVLQDTVRLLVWSRGCCAGCAAAAVHCSSCQRVGGGCWRVAWLNAGPPPAAALLLLTSSPATPQQPQHQVRESARRSVLTEAGISDPTSGKNMVRAARGNRVGQGAQGGTIPSCCRPRSC